MTLGIIFWILMILWLVLGLIPVPTSAEGPWRYWPWGGNILLFILLLLLGRKVFGAPVQG